MTDRRPMGALEAEVLGVLWDHDRPVTPGEVAQDVDGDLAYTTIMTILTRLWRKGTRGPATRRPGLRVHTAVE